MEQFSAHDLPKIQPYIAGKTKENNLCITFSKDCLLFTARVSGLPFILHQKYLKNIRIFYII